MLGIERREPQAAVRLLDRIELVPFLELQARKELLVRTAKNEGWLAGRFDFVVG